MQNSLLLLTFLLFVFTTNLEAEANFVKACSFDVVASSVEMLDPPMSDGLIAQAELGKWWNRAFTKTERNHMANSFRPNISKSKNSDGILHTISHDPKNKIKTLVDADDIILESCQLLNAMYNHFSASDDEIRIVISRKIMKQLAREGC